MHIKQIDRKKIKGIALLKKVNCILIIFKPVIVDKNFNKKPYFLFNFNSKFMKKYKHLELKNFH